MKLPLTSVKDVLCITDRSCFFGVEHKTYMSQEGLDRDLHEYKPQQIARHLA